MGITTTVGPALNLSSQSGACVTAGISFKHTSQVPKDCVSTQPQTYQHTRVFLTLRCRTALRNGFLDRRWRRQNAKQKLTTEIFSDQAGIPRFSIVLEPTNECVYQKRTLFKPNQMLLVFGSLGGGRYNYGHERKHGRTSPDVRLLQ